MLPEPIRALVADLGVCNDGRRAFVDLASALSSEMLDEIAGADYGFDFTDHRSALVEIVRSFELPDRREHRYPWEVLELIRWSEPDRTDSAPSRRGKRGHVMRGFCSAALLTAGGVPGAWEYFPGEVSSLIQLITSAIALGEPHLSSVASLVIWRLDDTMVEETDRLFFMLGLIIVFRSSKAFRLTSEQWSVLSTWLDEAELKARIQNGAEGGDWLLDVGIHHVGHGVWKKLTRELFLEGPPGAEIIIRRVAEWARPAERNR
jgi:hypothetical protein